MNLDIDNGKLFHWTRQLFQYSMLYEIDSNIVLTQIYINKHYVI